MDKTPPHEIIKKKSQAFRSHCLERAKKSGHSVKTIPMPKDIAAWLERQPKITKAGQLYFSCYLTNQLVHVDKIELDHRTPVTRRGDYSLDNLGVTDARMNQAKGTRSEIEFKALLAVIERFDDNGKSVIADLRRGASAFGRYK